MPRYFRARRSREIRAFLETNGFTLLHTKGDDDIYERMGYGHTVKIPNRDNDEISDGTMSQIKRCIERCGFNRKDILNWWKENGYGE